MLRTLIVAALLTAALPAQFSYRDLNTNAGGWNVQVVNMEPVLVLVTTGHLSLSWAARTGEPIIDLQPVAAHLFKPARCTVGSSFGGFLRSDDQFTPIRPVTHVGAHSWSMSGADWLPIFVPQPWYRNDDSF